MHTAHVLGRVGRFAAIVAAVAIPACSVAGAGHGAPVALDQPEQTSWSVARENQQPGTPGWQLTRVGPSHEIEGWADRTSVQPGGIVGLHVSTTAPSYVVHADPGGVVRGDAGPRGVAVSDPAGCPPAAAGGGAALAPERIWLFS